MLRTNCDNCKANPGALLWVLLLVTVQWWGHYLSPLFCLILGPRTIVAVPVWSRERITTTINRDLPTNCDARLWTFAEGKGQSFSRSLLYISSGLDPFSFLWMFRVDALLVIGHFETFSRPLARLHNHPGTSRI